MIRNYKQFTPRLAARVYVDPQASVIGQVTLAEDVSVWPMTVLRGDVSTITVGARTNLQDGSILHVNGPTADRPNGWPLVIGADVISVRSPTLQACRIAWCPRVTSAPMTNGQPLGRSAVGPLTCRIETS